jgi:hypothetical protein
MTFNSRNGIPWGTVIGLSSWANTFAVSARRHTASGKLRGIILRNLLFVDRICSICSANN